MNECTIIGHNGWTDYISQYALRRHFIQPFERVILFIDSMDKYNFVRNLYPEDNIDICVPETHSNYDGINSCICCHMLGSPFNCPRSANKCRFIDYSKYPNKTHIKLNAFDNYEKWDSFMQGKSFLESMYKYYGLHFIELSLLYKLPINTEKNILFFTSLNLTTKYIVIHDNKTLGDKIPIKSEMPAIEFNGISQNIIDTILTLQRAEEIHCIDSVYFFLILLLSIQYDYFLDKPVYLYYRSTNYNGPFIAVKQFIPNNWIIRSL